MKLRTRGTVLLLLAGLGAVMLAGPASAAPGKTVPANTWATSICTTTSDWLASFKADAQKMTSVPTAGVTIADVTAAVDQYLGTGVHITTEAIAALKKAGTPDATNGSKLAKSLLSAFTSIRGQFTSTRQQATALDPNATTYASDIGGVLDHLGTNVTNALDGFSKYGEKHGGKTLTKIMKTNKACAKLN